MSVESHEQNVSRIPESDRFLEMLALWAEFGLSIPVTLTFHGLRASGMMIGTAAYFSKLSVYMKSTANLSGEGALSMKATVDSIFDGIASDAKTARENETLEKALENQSYPAFIHLDDAAFFTADGLCTMNQSSILWRCRISEVVGFSLGAMRPGQDPHRRG